IRVTTQKNGTGWVLSKRVRFVFVNAAVRLRPANISGSVRSESSSTGDIADWEKPQPLDLKGGACAAVGLGTNGKPARDPETNLRKNRVDTAVSYHAATFDQVLALPWSGLPRSRAGWKAQDSLQVVRYEGP